VLRHFRSLHQEAGMVLQPPPVPSGAGTPYEVVLALWPAIAIVLPCSSSTLRSVALAMLAQGSCQVERGLVLWSRDSRRVRVPPASLVGQGYPTAQAREITRRAPLRSRASPQTERARANLAERVPSRARRGSWLGRSRRPC